MTASKRGADNEMSIKKMPSLEKCVSIGVGDLLSRLSQALLLSALASSASLFHMLSLLITLLTVHSRTQCAVCCLIP